MRRRHITVPPSPAVSISVRKAANGWIVSPGVARPGLLPDEFVAATAKELHQIIVKLQAGQRIALLEALTNEDAPEYLGVAHETFGYAGEQK